jgi:hypothetical protein
MILGGEAKAGPQRPSIHPKKGMLPEGRKGRIGFSGALGKAVEVITVQNGMRRKVQVRQIHAGPEGPPPTRFNHPEWGSQPSEGKFYLYVNTPT